MAERLLAIGSSSDGRAHTIVQTSKVPEVPGGFLNRRNQWQVRAFLQATPTNPNTGADFNNGKPVDLESQTPPQLPAAESK